MKKSKTNSLKTKLGPYLLITTLLLIITFTFGVKYGRKVEETNKAIKVILSITPTSSPSPTPTEKPLEFLEYSHQSCGIKFLYPQTLSETNQSSKSAKFINKKTNLELLSFWCEKKKKPLLQDLIKDEKTASEELKLKKKKITVVLKRKNKIDYYLFSIKNPINSKYLTISIAKPLYPLFEKTFQFIR